jgi:hypothetical protein
MNAAVANGIPFPPRMPIAQVGLTDLLFAFFGMQFSPPSVEQMQIENHFNHSNRQGKNHEQAKPHRACSPASIGKRTSKLVRHQALNCPLR